jgi:Flp pilus assembly protein TadG
VICRLPTLSPDRRAGAVVPMVAILIVFLMGMVAFAVDIGYIAVVQKELQNAADAAALAGASQLLDRGALKGNPNMSATASKARDVAQQFSAYNKGGGVSLALSRNNSNDLGGDVVCGYISTPTNLNSSLDNQAQKYNSVRVRPRRTAAQNGSLGLFFGPILGRSTQDVSGTATATYEDGITGFKMARSGVSTSKLLPFAIKVDIWNAAVSGSGPDEWSYNPVTGAYAPGSDGIKEMNLYPTKGTTPGNFGTVDLGDTNNSNADTTRQVLYGPNQSDFDKMGGQIALGPDGTLILQGDTGISAGFKDELASIRGQKRIIPIYSQVTGQGNNTYFTIVGFGGIVITDVQLTTGDKFMTIQPEYVQDATGIKAGTTSVTSFITKPLRLTR